MQVFGATPYWFLPSVSLFLVHFGTKFAAFLFGNHPVDFNHVKSGLATCLICLNSVYLTVAYLNVDHTLTNFVRH
jgi:hypothetical protein